MQKPAPTGLLDRLGFRESILLLRGDCSLGCSVSIHCLAIGVYLRDNGDIDNKELEGFLDQQAGPGQWLMTSVWMFARPPVLTRPPIESVPVICPETAASRVNLSCSGSQPQRILRQHVVGAVELRGWRWVAKQVFPEFGGQFPWEREVRAVQHVLATASRSVHD